MHAQKHEVFLLPLNCNCGNLAGFKQPPCFCSVYKDMSSPRKCEHTVVPNGNCHEWMVGWWCMAGRERYGKELFLSKIWLPELQIFTASEYITGTCISIRSQTTG